MDMGWGLGSLVLLAAWAPATAAVAGLVVGARHAIEPDHLAAVAVL